MTVTLGDETMRYRRTWRPRLRAWYVDIWHADGTPVILGRRLSVGQTLQGGLPINPGAVILVIGPDEYGREDLGDRLEEIVIDFDELPDVEGEDDGFIADIIDEAE